MYKVETHNTALVDTAYGSRVSVAGNPAPFRWEKARLGMIHVPSFAEQSLRQSAERANPDNPFNRGYVTRHSVPVVAWRYDPVQGFQCVGNDLSYDQYGTLIRGRYVGTARRLAVARLGRDVLTVAEAPDWARDALGRAATAATAIVFREEGIVAAWERGILLDDPLVLVARNPALETL